ncbi:helix-turn-helix domain-containing protein [Cohnella sp. JJ-181]|uniref:helix-turn-helix domain-containing protein n=1 Tax=Cohnella rhizoplanae TaxID=2974897 RepID=UPI0022FFB590|nr:helix-turn-helix domain-containing protein [Cohnella sp. JJ-181]CAI6083226.1 Arabinose operon regulatory protein [Cohnella sp. JJ-181]
MEAFDEPSQYAGMPYGVLITGHFNVGDTYATHRPQGMNDWLIAYTLGGQGFFETPEDHRPCAAGDLTLLKPGTPHRYGTAKGEMWNFAWAHFASHQMEEQLLPAEPLLIHPLESDTARRRVLQAFERILSDSRERNAYWQDLCVNSLREILMLLTRERDRPIDPRIAEAMHYLSVHMRSPVQIEALSKAIGVSPSRLSHLFKEQTGRSVIDTLNQMRIRQAALLLEHTNRSASEVAYEVGFHNYNHFMNQFRKWTGANPSGYRKNNRAEQGAPRPKQP